MNVTTGTMLMKAQEYVADVYLSPTRKKYWLSVALQEIKYTCKSFKDKIYKMKF